MQSCVTLLNLSPVLHILRGHPHLCMATWFSRLAPTSSGSLPWLGLPSPDTLPVSSVPTQAASTMVISAVKTQASCAVNHLPCIWRANPLWASDRAIFTSGSVNICRLTERPLPSTLAREFLKDKREPPVFLFSRTLPVESIKGYLCIMENNSGTSL